jgi:hypothetical protein
MQISISMYWGISSLLIVLVNVHIVGGVFSIGKLRAPLSAQNGHNPVPLFVMLQLDTVDPTTNRLKDPEGLKYQLLELHRTGVDGVMVDVWWGIVEKKGPKLYNWTGYDELVDLVASSGLKLQWWVLPAMSSILYVCTATLQMQRQTCTYDATIAATMQTRPHPTSTFAHQGTKNGARHRTVVHAHSSTSIHSCKYDQPSSSYSPQMHFQHAARYLVHIPAVG